jgi:hypothetical protein
VFFNREKRLSRRQFRDFVRWLAELTQERRAFLMALCYRESQVRDLVSFFGALTREQQYDSLIRLGLTHEQAEQAIVNGELVAADRRRSEQHSSPTEDASQLDMLNHSSLDAPPELLEPPRPLKKRIEMRSSLNL